MVKLNGREYDIAGITLEEYLKQNNYELKRIAVECNGEIVFKANYESTLLKDGDCYEIVSFVGGG